MMNLKRLAPVGWAKAFAQHFQIGKAFVRRAHVFLPSLLRSVTVGTALCLRTWPAPLPTLRASALALACTASLAHAQGDATRGEKYFEDCASCHTLANGQNGVGPSLF